MQILLLLRIYLYQFLCRSHSILCCPFVSTQCQYFVCMRHDVCCATACWLVVSFSLFFFSIAPLSPFVFVISVAVSHSSTPPLESCYSVSFTYCMFDVCCASLVISRHCFQCYLSILRAILTLLRCCVRVILMPSPVLSLHYLLGYLGAVVPVLSYATIKVVTFLSDNVLKFPPGMSWRFLLGFFDCHV